MIRKFCRVFCLVFLIGDLQTNYLFSGLSHKNGKKAHLSNPSIDDRGIALLEDTRHQVSIRLIAKDTTYGEGHICGGSLISHRVVLTAAQCLIDAHSNKPRHPAELYVVMGTLNRYQKTGHTIVSRVTHIRYPSSFDITTGRDDIGLLFLSQEIPEDHPSVRPIELNRESVVEASLAAVTGWGTDEKGQVSHHLLAINASTLDAFSCAKSFGRLITEGMLCAVDTENDGHICHFDIGSPLVHDGKQIGIASWANSCAMKDLPAVYTDVAYHSEWIRRELADKNNTDSSIWGLLGFLTFSWVAFRDRPKIMCRV